MKIDFSARKAQSWASGCRGLGIGPQRREMLLGRCRSIFGAGKRLASRLRSPLALGLGVLPERATVDLEFQWLLSEIDRSAAVAEFNGTLILQSGGDGLAGSARRCDLPDRFAASFVWYCPKPIAIAVENTAAAELRIRDVDFASETAELTRNQVLQQAGISVLAQANISTQ